MTDINENLEDAFGNSLKNKFDEYSDYEADLEIEAMMEAKKLQVYLSSNKIEKLYHRTLLVHSRLGVDYRFQSTTVKFNKSNGDFCNAEFSVPIDFNAPIRLWTEDLRGKKVWSTFYKIEKTSCNPELLFNFLGKYTERFSEDDIDELPF